jgi:hypothetical protein
MCEPSSADGTQSIGEKQAAAPLNRFHHVGTELKDARRRNVWCRVGESEHLTENQPVSHLLMLKDQRISPLRLERILRTTTPANPVKITILRVLPSQVH